jgi:signal transduction histidine kinase
MNLIDNAVKLTPEGGLVKARAEVLPEDPYSVRVAISDTGCGFSAEDRSKIFDSMHKVKDSISSSRKRLGLGLFICRELVWRQGGRICAESEPGRGSTFY